MNVKKILPRSEGNDRTKGHCKGHVYRRSWKEISTWR